MVTIEIHEQRAEEAVGFGPTTPLKKEPTQYVLADRPSSPGRILLGSIRDARLRVLTPIPVKFAVEQSHYIAEAEGFNEFGFGGDPSEALRDLQRALCELYFTLEQEQDRLGPDLQQVWEKLRQTVRHRA